MKNTLNRLEKLAALLCMTAFLFTLFGSAAVKAANLPTDDECLAAMAQETAAYMQAAGLQVPNSAYAFANSSGEKVYSLTSQDAVKAGAVVNRTQSVIHYKNSEGQSDFYVVNLEAQAERLTYTISRNSVLLDRLELALYIPGGGSDPCAGALTQAQVDTILQNLLAQANADCKTRYTCLYQRMGTSCAYVMYMIKPTSWRCRILTPVDVQNAIERAISKTAVTP